MGQEEEEEVYPHRWGQLWRRQSTVTTKRAFVLVSFLFSIFFFMFCSPAKMQHKAQPNHSVSDRCSHSRRYSYSYTEKETEIHIRMYVRATCGKRALHNRKSITCYLPRRTAEDADASRRRRKGSCGCGWFFFTLSFFIFCLLRKQTNNWKPNKVLWMPMWVHSRTHWAHTRRRWRLLHLHNDSSVARVSRTVHSFLSTKVAENKREFLVYYFGLGWFPQFFAYIKTRWQNDGRTRRAAATCAISWRGKRRRVARERERDERRNKAGALRAHTTVAFSGRRTSGREQSACRTAGGVRE